MTKLAQLYMLLMHYQRQPTFPQPHSLVSCLEAVSSNCHARPMQFWHHSWLLMSHKLLPGNAGRGQEYFGSKLPWGTGHLYLRLLRYMFGITVHDRYEHHQAQQKELTKPRTPIGPSPTSPEIKQHASLHCHCSSSCRYMAARGVPLVLALRSSSATLGRQC